MTKRPLTDAQRDYEAKRAAKAGMSLDKWLSSKEKAAEAEAKAKQKAVEPPKPAKPPGMLKRLIDRAHQPLKPEGPKSGGVSASAKGQAARKPVSHRRQSP